MRETRTRRSTALPARLATLALCGVLLGTSGCGGTQAPPGTPQPGTTQPGTTQAGTPPAGADPIDTGLHLPIEGYLLTARQIRTLGDAMHALSLSCLDRFKVARPSIPAPTTSPRPGDANITVNPRRRYGILSPGAAARYGYHFEPGTLPEQQSEPKWSKEVNLVLLGGNQPGHPDQVNGMTVPDGGCVGEAERRLEARSGTYGDGEEAALVNMRSFEATRKDPRVLAAITAWSDCMRAERHPQSDPLAAPSGGAPLPPTATPEEIAIATADIACKRRTHLALIWSQAEREYQEKAIAAKASEFAQIKADLKVQVSRAEGVLGKQS